MGKFTNWLGIVPSSLSNIFYFLWHIPFVGIFPFEIVCEHFEFQIQLELLYMDKFWNIR